jgi:hypothetical protein
MTMSIKWHRDDFCDLSGALRLCMKLLLPADSLDDKDSFSQRRKAPLRSPRFLSR